MNENPIFCAIDTVDITAARALLARLAGRIGGVKLGLEFFAANGADGVRQVMAGNDLPLFLDLKLHDIPHTVAGAVRALLPLTPTYTTLHAAGGLAMMQAAAEAAGGRCKLLAVTMLTSLIEQDLPGLGIAPGLSDQVARLGALARRAEIDGLVCSAHELSTLRRVLGSAMTLAVPGIRAPGAAADDQRRVLSAAQAFAAGADLLVIGRPITNAADPAAAAAAILASLRAA
jgi:orotidine-5'-phosphate decarboxylase